MAAGGGGGPRPGDRSDTQPLGLTRLQDSVHAGFEGTDGPVMLDAEHREGDPPQPGSASVPRVDFLGDLVARGDLDGDGEDEAAVMLTTNFGSTGVYYYVAVVDQLAAENRNLDTRPVGDRIQLRGMHIEEGHLVLDIVRAGPGGAGCNQYSAAVKETDARLRRRKLLRGPVPGAPGMSGAGRLCTGDREPLIRA